MANLLTIIAALEKCALELVLELDPTLLVPFTTDESRRPCPAMRDQLRDLSWWQTPFFAPPHLQLLPLAEQMYGGTLQDQMDGDSTHPKKFGPHAHLCSLGVFWKTS